MSLDNPAKNKMIQTPPAKKGFHFASDNIHYAEFIEAETIEAATALYHKIKRPLTGTAPQSTPSPKQQEETNG